MRPVFGQPITSALQCEATGVEAQELQCRSPRIISDARTAPSPPAHGSPPWRWRFRNPRSSPSTVLSTPAPRASPARWAKYGPGGHAIGRNAHQPDDIEPMLAAGSARRTPPPRPARCRSFAPRAPILTCTKQGSRLPARAISARQHPGQLVAVQRLDAHRTAPPPRAPCWSAAARSGAILRRHSAARSSGHLSLASCTRFSPNTRCPASRNGRSHRRRRSWTPPPAPPARAAGRNAAAPGRSRPRSRPAARFALALLHAFALFLLTLRVISDDGPVAKIPAKRKRRRSLPAPASLQAIPRTVTVSVERYNPREMEPRWQKVWDDAQSLRRPQRRSARALLRARDVPLSVGAHPYGPCAQLYHGRRAGALSSAPAA